jgi:hypothetical protein
MVYQDANNHVSELSSDCKDLPNASQHGCFLFYPLSNIAYSSTLNISLGDLVKAQQKPDGNNGWIVSDVLETIDELRSSWPVWESSSFPVGHDLYPYVQRLLGNRLKVASADSSQLAMSDESHAIVFRLSESARKLIQGKRLAYEVDTPEQERRPKQLTLSLTKSSQKRIQKYLPDFKKTILSIKIQEVKLIIFRTNCAFLMTEVSFGEEKLNIHPYLIVEGLYRLSRINQIAWSHQNDINVDNVNFSFGSLVYSLLGLEKHAESRYRIYTSSYIQFIESPSVLSINRLLFQLAKHYTDDYLVPDDFSGIERVSQFQNVYHAFALEGCVTVVDLGVYHQSSSPEFLRNFFSHTYRINYLPVILLGCHEFNFLLFVTDKASIWPKSEDDSEAIRLMGTLRYQITNYMLCYRFSYVSHINMHNSVNHAIRKSLGLDKMLAEIERDTMQIDKFLNQAASTKIDERSRNNEKRFRWVVIIGAGTAAWLAASNILEKVFEISVVNSLMINWLLLTKEKIDLIVAGGALFVSFVAGWVAGKRIR